MRRIAATLTLLALLAAPVLALNPYTYLKSIAVLQTAGRNMCSVTAINKEKGYYLTAAHCVIQNFPSAQQDIEESEPPQDYSTPIPNEDMSIDGRPALLHDINVLEDMAVLVVQGATRSSLKLSSKRPLLLDPITMAGHPFGWDHPTVMVGTVAAPYLRFTTDPSDFPFNKYYMILQVSGAPGNSGSSVVNANMEVVSVVQISWGRAFESVMGTAPYTELARFAGKYFAK